MGVLLAELGYNEIISAEIAVNLRSYIASRNPTLSVAMRAGVFADAVNRIVDSRLPGFDAELAKKLKDLLFRDITIKPDSSIDCLDVFKAAVKLKTTGSEFLSQLNDWLSAVLDKPVVKESLIDLILQSHSLMESKPDIDITDILNSVEQSTGGLQYAGQQRSLSIGNNIQRLSLDVTTHKKSLLSSLLRRRQFVPETKKLLMTSAAAAVVFFSMFFAGNPTAVSYENKPDIYSLYTIQAESNSAVPEMISFHPTQETSYFAAQLTIMNPVKEDSSMSKASSRRMKATAYDLSVESCGKRPEHPQYGITSSGTKAIVGRTVAVDPKVIPLGSRVHISFPQEYSHLDGVYIAEDTGRLIKGDEIDIFFGEDSNGSRSIYESAMKFGVRYVDVRVLD